MSNIHTPKVSIVIPVYNGGNYMAQAIDSALAQTYSNFEVLVINDGSNDGGETEQIARSYGEKIKYHYKPNGGVASALNLGISKMTGDYFSWLSHDDLYSPQKIEKQIHSLLECEECLIAFCDYTIIDKDGKIIRECSVSSKAEISMRCFLALDVATGLHGCSLLVNKKLFDEFGVFDESLKCTQDYDLWQRFAGRARFVHVKESLVFSRQHAQQDSKTKTDLCTEEADVLHSKILANIKGHELSAYFNDDISEAIKINKVFFDSGYYRTSTSLLRGICRTFENCQRSLTFFKDGIFSGSNKEFDRFAETLSDCLKLPQDKPTVLFYNNVWFKGGVERVLSIITKHLIKNYHIIILTLENKNGFELHRDVIQLTIGNDRNYLKRLVEIVTLIHPDIFVGNPNIFFEFLDIYRILEERQIRTIACNHAYYFLPLWSPWLYPLFGARELAYEHAGAVTWLTNFSSQVYALSHNNSALMPNPSTYDLMPETTEGIIRNDKIILCVGRFHDTIKRLDRALKVFSEVVKVHPDAELHLVGGYDLDISTNPKSSLTIRAQIEDLNIDQSKIKFWGEQENLQQFYKKASVLILTSDMEGFGMVLIEAGVHGIPTVIFEVPGLEDIVAEGMNGYIVPQDDISAMSEKVSLILSDNDLQMRLGLNARDLVKRFDQAMIAERWDKLFNLLLKKTERKEVNELLRANFMNDVSDKDAFIRKLSTIYHEHLQKFMDQTLLGSTCGVPFDTQADSKAKIKALLRLMSKTVRYLKQNGLKQTVTKIQIQLHSAKLARRKAANSV